MCKLYSTVLMIGTRDKADQLNELPLRIIVLETGKEAIGCLKEENIDTVVSRWNLLDMPDGELLDKIRSAMPKMPTVAFVEPGNWQQEIMARSLGVTAILSEDINDDYFRNTVCQILHIKQIASVCVSSGSM